MFTLTILTKSDKVALVCTAGTFSAIVAVALAYGGNTTVLDRDWRHAKTLCRNHSGGLFVQRPGFGKVVLTITCNDGTVLKSPTGGAD